MNMSKTGALHNPALALADCWQRSFPLAPEPFADLAASADLSGHEVIDLMQTLKDQGVLARIGAAVRPNTAGASTLAAMAVPAEKLDEVAALVNSHPAVNHNYERDHQINLWFVVTAGNRSEVNATLDTIAAQTGFEVLDLPLEQAYHIDLGFRLGGTARRAEASDVTSAQFMTKAQDTQYAIDEADRELLKALEDGLDLVPRPYARLSARLGLREMEVLDRLQSLVDRGVIARFGCILRHRRLGYLANAMAVWNVPDDQVDDIASGLAVRDEVTLCYRRTRRPPSWPYNLFAMIHGHERATVLDQIADASRATGLEEFDSTILFSRRCFKQSAARMAPQVVPIQRTKGAA